MESSGVEQSSLTDEVKRLVLRRGAGLVGIADPKALAEVSISKDPFLIMRDAKAVIVFALPLEEDVIEDAPGEKYNNLVRLHFQRLREIASEVSSWLEGKGYRAYPCHDQAGVEHKRAAELAGLGKVGDHTLLITQKYGCNVHLNSVITDAPLEFDEVIEEELCDHCGECIQNCPANAIKSGKKVDAKLCLDYRRNRLKRSYCGICMKSCWNHLNRSSRACVQPS
jgi:epoxyqueuosine reductase QueG